MSENELLRAFRQNRSEDAFGQLVRRYAGLVYSVAKRRTANATLAEDITQLVFIRLAKTPPDLHTGVELAAWLHRTTVNVTIDTWRSESRRHLREQQAADMQTNTPEDALWQDLAPNLDEGLNLLNDEDRQVLMLRFFDHKPMRDVGATLGISEDAAKMRVNRALERLRTQLGVPGAACTIAVLGSILTARSVEAAPAQLLSCLASRKLPAAAAATGIGAVFAVLARLSTPKIAAGVAVLALVGAAVIHIAAQQNAPETATTTPPTKLADNAATVARREKFNTTAFATPARSSSEISPPIPDQRLFQVIDSETSNGLAGARIRAVFFGPGGKSERHELLTDQGGAANIPLPDDPAKGPGGNVFVVAEGHVPKAVSFQSEIPAEYTIKLDSAMTVGGSVVDEQGVPVGGVKIMIDTPGNKPGQSENVDFQTCPVTSEDDGSWICTYIPKDYTNEIRFNLSKPGYAPSSPVAHVDKTDLNNLRLVINRGFIVTGQITDMNYHPIANASIRVLDATAGAISRQQSSKTDDDGAFTLTGVAGSDVFYRVSSIGTGQSKPWEESPGCVHVDLAIQAEGFASQSVTVRLTGQTNAADFKMSPGHVFRGRVLDKAGNPVSNAMIRTDFDFKNQIRQAFDLSTNTDGEGRFEWDSAPEEEICYWFEAFGFVPVRGLALAADGTDHSIILTSTSANAK